MVREAQLRGIKPLAVGAEKKNKKRKVSPKQPTAATKKKKVAATDFEDVEVID